MNTTDDTVDFVPISGKELEAIMWTVAVVGDLTDREPDHPTDPLWELLQHYSRETVMADCDEIWPILHGEPMLPRPTTPVRRDLLRLCVEKSLWIIPYVNAERTPYNQMMLLEARSALRTLAAKLELFGIEISHIPYE